MKPPRKRHRGSSARPADRKAGGVAPGGRSAPAVSHGSTAPAHRRTDPLIVLALALGSFLLYARTFSYPFVDYDDPRYIGQPIVQQGLTPAGIKWAFTTTTFANWLPVTWLSHMFDCTLYGLKHPGGHHATSAALHAINAALVFLILRTMTGARWRGAAVAALFAVHPLRVESVVWIAERKDVLCATFFLLALLAYGWYVRRPSAARYAAVAVAYALGLMSKTMIVTLPCVLLLLDYWPLGRLRIGKAARDAPPERDGQPKPRPIGWLLLEKTPLVAMAVISSAWTVVLQHDQGAMEGGRQLTLGERLANAAVSVVRYLWKTIRPVDLAAFYPHPVRWPAWQVAASVALIVALTAIAFALVRSRPYVTVGWLWFLGMLVPVLGVIQVGLQAMADRYTYLPSIGLLVAVVWPAAELLRRAPALRLPAGAAVGTLLVVLAFLTWLQESYWSDRYVVYQHMLDVDPNNFLAEDMVGYYLAAAGDDAGAVPHYRRSIELKDDFADSHHNLAASLDRLGKKQESVEEHRKAAAINPRDAWIIFGLAGELADVGDYPEAERLFAESARLFPMNPNIYAEWGNALLAQGRTAEAAAQFNRALQLDPSHAAARAGLAKVAAATQPARGN